MSNTTLTEETLMLCPSDPLLDQLSKVKGILGLMGSLNCAGSNTIQNEDLAWTLITLSEILDGVEKDLQEIDTQWGMLRGFYLAHHTSLEAQTPKDQARVNGNPKGKAKVRKEG